jgi:hypothetical protein
MILDLVKKLHLQVTQKPNAHAHLLPKAGARHERTLEAVSCTPWFGWERPVVCG